MRLAYADPPYPGRAHLYADHPDYAGEVDHHALIDRLRGFDGWALSTNAESLHWLLPLAPEARVLAWTKHTGPQDAGTPAPALAGPPAEDLPPSAGAALAAGWALPVNHLSATQVAMFMRCPEQYRQRYILGIKEAPGAAMQPESVELGFLATVPGCPVPFKGYIDFVGTRENGVPWDDGYESTDLVVDYKTSGKTVRELKPDWGIQARLYQMETGRRVEYHVAVKTKDPAIITPVDAPGLALEPTETALAVTAELLARVTTQMEHLYATFGPDRAWPGAITHPWACGFCGFRAQCKWWAT